MNLSKGDSIFRTTQLSQALLHDPNFELISDNTVFQLLRWPQKQERQSVYIQDQKRY